jgi:cell wall-associated NlpC family hydrolase
MLKVSFISTFFLTASFASLFTISDSNGSVYHSKKLNHLTNDCISQKVTDYSLQAMYDEIRKAEKVARKVAIVKKSVEKITQATVKAKKRGVKYTLTDDDRSKLLKYAKYFKGGKYVWGGTTPQGFDCSGYVQYLYKKHGVKLPRTAWSQSKKGLPVDIDNLQKGDLLFFLTDKKRGIPVTHVGIYLGNGEFIHAASKKKGIIISPLYYGHYAKTFVSARRVLDS